ncbi:phosphomannomutase/phosphoglucomutase [Acinetobacter baumannii]|uniref:phosphomannomutase/phosphoglucomutase n=1 Tax=Acinetobacter baumannii TaxID=470 RepID=UPI0004F74A39|nr:phosphomannomutase/phosphoglucomutase [Acinetobacter baumannii]AIL79859.1 phosphomannomutase [Acinetobacter baumannii]ATD19396.1 phosphomannomutase/phosphoglucomutase [Acinetobacter baumannii]AXG86774.1 phosphomannomutase/phosphoglucomutase [Acinetobacter baumannii]EII5853880.1 phosphomannomutase/phosphoglucomutase [Acinetobacter baumannii]EJO3108168.1 phosphomannomutase/phosphoglucomutase [Acinetobacter baumannii]
MTTLTCFKAYDIRGKLGTELNEEIAYKIGRAYGQIYKPKTVVVGCDIRLSSEALKQATIRGLNDAGVNVFDLGMTGTEEVYFAAFHLDVQGGIEVTASHNPMDYNGMKLVRENARPISADTGLKEIQTLAETNNFEEVSQKGTTQSYNILPEFVDHLLTYIEPAKIRPLKLVVNAGNGAAGHVIDAIEEKFKTLNVPVEFIKIHHEADGTFPNGIPNPILIENRDSTRNAVLEHKADMGIAWDGDFDRCFLFDEKGQFIEGYYIVGLLAQAFLIKQSGEKIVHDPRLVWNTFDIVDEYKGVAVQSKSGHAFIKDVMRAHNAVYGGEMSAHHYFRDFAYCDSGMIPWLLTIALLSETGQSLSTLVENMIAKFPCSGEINFKVADTQTTIQKIFDFYADQNPQIDRTDGVSLDFGTWRFNVRASNTEPLLRLNIESRADRQAQPMQYYIDELTGLIQN